MDACELDHRIESLYGEVDWRNAEGLLQVAAIDAATGAILAIGPTSPASAADRFILGLARARADFIVTSGSILRGEPGLVHAFSDDAEEDRALRGWRRRVCARDGEPGLAVVSYSGDFPNEHPALGASKTGIVWTSKRGRRRLGSSVGHWTVEVGMAEDSIEIGSGGSDIGESLGGLIEHLRVRYRARTILIEAGPTLAHAFYVRRPGHSLRLDELLLSRFEGDAPPQAIGPAFESEQTIREVFGDPCTRRMVGESSGRWHFERYRRSVSA